MDFFMIRYHENVLDPRFIDELDKFVQAKKDKKEWQTNLFWPEYIIKSSTVVPVLSLDHVDTIRNYLREVYNKILPESSKHKMEINYYLWPPLSYIPFHDDSHKLIASTIYLNKTWDINHGGFFMYLENHNYHHENYKSIPPKYNSCVINDNKIKHGTTLTTMDAPIRKTLQIFFYD